MEVDGHSDPRIPPIIYSPTQVQYWTPHLYKVLPYLVISTTATLSLVGLGTREAMLNLSIAGVLPVQDQEVDLPTHRIPAPVIPTRMADISDDEGAPIIPPRMAQISHDEEGLVLHPCRAEINDYKESPVFPPLTGESEVIQRGPAVPPRRDEMNYYQEAPVVPPHGADIEEAPVVPPRWARSKSDEGSPPPPLPPPLAPEDIDLL